MRIFLLPVLALFAGVSYAQDLTPIPLVAMASDSPGEAHAEIVGPTGGKPGDILTLDATRSAGDEFTWRVFSENGADPSHLALEGGRKAIIASRPGRYVVFLAVSWSSASGKSGIDSKIWTVTVDGQTPIPPTPNPQPTPDPVDPSPDLPEGQFGLARVSHRGRGLVPGWTRQEAAVLAAAHRLAAENASKTPYALVADMQTTVTKEVTGKLSADQLKRWLPWQAEVKRHTDQLEASQKLTNREGWMAAFQEIALGLEK